MFLAGTGSAFAQSPHVTLKWLDPDMSERWVEPASLLIRRTDTWAPEILTLTFTGSATAGSDYRILPTGGPVMSIAFPIGLGEVTIQAQPIFDAINESNETLTANLPDHGLAASIQIFDATSLPTHTEASRFLLHAAFGADDPTLSDVRRLGFSSWINEQFTRPTNMMQPLITEQIRLGRTVTRTSTKIAFWENVMSPRATITNPNALQDPLRQRVAYSLLQHFVISQFNDILSVNSEGVANFYDMLLHHSFGNYRDLLRDVILHPCMGIYLSHVGNERADLRTNRFPDENFARELMQLFTIGLWELNRDGTRRLRNGAPIPTYDNNTIREYARVFTGFQFGGPRNNQFGSPIQDYLHPMKLWDSRHDMGSKRLLSGIVTPERVPDVNDPGAATRADVELAIDSLFLHPNCGPFLARSLIQRLVTSNPTPAYISRVAQAFNDNGSGVRGDMRAVIRAILLDSEARTFGTVAAKKREPYLTLINMAKAFDARPPSGNWTQVSFHYDLLLQEPFQSPSVFNFYQPNHTPAGEMTNSGVAGPEFQIMTAVTAVGLQNTLFRFIHEFLARGTAPTDQQIRLNLDPYVAIADDPDILVHRLAAGVMDRRLSPRTSQIIRNAVWRGIRITNPNWRRERVNMALYLIVSAPEFHIQR